MWVPSFDEWQNVGVPTPLKASNPSSIFFYVVLKQNLFAQNISDLPVWGSALLQAVHTALPQL